MWLLVGLPAAGKSTIADLIVEREGALLIDADEAKKRLPEYNGGVPQGTRNDADEVNSETEESRSAKGGFSDAQSQIDNSGENGQNKNAGTTGAEVVVTGGAFGGYKDIKELRAKALRYYAQNLQGTSVENRVLGKIDIDENGIVNFTGSGKGELKNSSAKEHKLLLVKHLPQLIRDATNITDKGSEKPTHKKEHFYYLHTQAIVDGKSIPVEITLVRRNNGEIQYYNHILPSEENKKDVVVSTEPVPETPAYGPPSIPTSSVSDNISQTQQKENRAESPEQKTQAALTRAAFLMPPKRRKQTGRKAEKRTLRQSVGYHREDYQQGFPGVRQTRRRGEKRGRGEGCNRKLRQLADTRIC